MSHDFVSLGPDLPVIYCTKCLVAYRLLSIGQWQLIPAPKLPECVGDEVQRGSDLGYTQGSGLTK